MKKRILKKKVLAIIFLGVATGVFLFFRVADIRQQAVNVAMRKGGYYFNDGAYDLQKAERWYRAAIWLDPSMPLAHYQLSRIYLVEGRTEEALREVNKELNIRPLFGRAYYMRGLIDGFSKNLDAAEADFKKILELGKLDEYAGALDATGWAVYNDLSWVQFQKGEYRDVEKTARAGLEKYPHNPWLLNSLGLGLMNLKKTKEAASAFDSALQSAQKLTVEDARRAYPGNDPAGAEDKRQQIIQQIRFNQAIIK